MTKHHGSSVKDDETQGCSKMTRASWPMRCAITDQSRALGSAS